VAGTTHNVRTARQPGDVPAADPVGARFNRPAERIRPAELPASQLAFPGTDGRPAPSNVAVG
jgi:hypothetical protein